MNDISNLINSAEAKKLEPVLNYRCQALLSNLISLFKCSPGLKCICLHKDLSETIRDLILFIEKHFERENYVENQKLTMELFKEILRSDNGLSSIEKNFIDNFYLVEDMPSISQHQIILKYISNQLNKLISENQPSYDVLQRSLNCIVVTCNNPLGRCLILYTEYTKSITERSFPILNFEATLNALCTKESQLNNVEKLKLSNTIIEIALKLFVDDPNLLRRGEAISKALINSKSLEALGNKISEFGLIEAQIDYQYHYEFFKQKSRYESLSSELKENIEKAKNYNNKDLKSENFYLPTPRDLHVLFDKYKPKFEKSFINYQFKEQQNVIKFLNETFKIDPKNYPSFLNSQIILKNSFAFKSSLSLSKTHLDSNGKSIEEIRLENYNAKFFEFNDFPPTFQPPTPPGKEIISKENELKFKNYSGPLFQAFANNMSYSNSGYSHNMNPIPMPSHKNSHYDNGTKDQYRSMPNNNIPNQNSYRSGMSQMDNIPKPQSLPIGISPSNFNIPFPNNTPNSYQNIGNPQGNTYRPVPHQDIISLSPEDRIIVSEITQIQISSDPRKEQKIAIILQSNPHIVKYLNTLRGVK